MLKLAVPKTNHPPIIEKTVRCNALKVGLESLSDASLIGYRLYCMVASESLSMFADTTQ